MNSKIGLKLRNIRKERKLTLTELADATGFSVGFLSNLERDLCSPSLENLFKICEALDISLVKLLEEKNRNVEVVRAEEREVAFEQEGLVKYESISFDGAKMEGLVLTLDPRCENVEEWAHTYDEMGYVLKGQLTIWIEDRKYTLETGDTVYIDALKKHSICNETDEPCVGFFVTIQSDHHK